MIRRKGEKHLKGLLLLGSTIFLLGIVGCGQNSEQEKATQQEPQVIELTQTGCQFLETEAKDYNYTPNSKKDCEQINAGSLSERQPNFKPLHLAPGEYIFKVTNRNVPYELGFYLRGEGVNSVTLPKVSGGGLTKGITKEYRITLRPGSYVFSCPLNPTPDYPVIVH